MSFAPKPQTYVPDLGTWFSTPSAMRRRTASRMGVRLTPQAQAKEGSESFCPGLSSPLASSPDTNSYARSSSFSVCLLFFMLALYQNL